MKSSEVLRGRYKIISEISRGGMGIVYLAKDLLKNKEVAIKKSFFSDEKQAQKAFEMEAKLLARLEHQGLPKVLDYFLSENNFPALVMDFIEGETLEDLLESGKYRIGRGLNSIIIVEWALQIVSILKYLHNFEPPVVHRDIKPNNIKLTTEGKIVLLDFGLAKGSVVSIVGGMSGYSPFEQVNRTGTDPRSDIYSLGATLFHLLANEQPLTAIDRFQSIYSLSFIKNAEKSHENSRRTDVQKSVVELNPQVSQDLSEVVMKAMALMPEDRFQTVEELETALRKSKQNLLNANEEFPPGQSAFITNKVITEASKKAKPIIEEGEESLSDWQPPHSENSANSADEISDIDDDPAENISPQSELNPTIAPTAFFGSQNFSEITHGKPQPNLNPTELLAENFPSVEDLDFSQNNAQRKKNGRMIHLFLGVITIIVLCAIGALAWYLIAPNQNKSNLAAAQNIVEPPPENKTTVKKNPFEISVYRTEKNGQKSILDRNHQFSDNEKFQFALKSAKDGFLYVVSRNNKNEAILAYPRPDQTDNFVKKDSESIFPRETTFEFKPDSPSEAWIYFVVLSSREDVLANRIKKILDTNKDKSVTNPEVSELFKDLDKLAEDSAKDAQEKANSANQPIIEVKKIQKK